MFICVTVSFFSGLLRATKCAPTQRDRITLAKEKLLYFFISVAFGERKENPFKKKKKKFIYYILPVPKTVQHPHIRVFMKLPDRNVSCSCKTCIGASREKQTDREKERERARWGCHRLRAWWCDFSPFNDEIRNLSFLINGAEKRGKILKFNVIKRVKKSLVAFYRSEITSRYYDVARNRKEEEKIVFSHVKMMEAGNLVNSSLSWYSSNFF